MIRRLLVLCVGFALATLVAACGGEEKKQPNVDMSKVGAKDLSKIKSNEAQFKAE